MLDGVESEPAIVLRLHIRLICHDSSLRDRTTFSLYYYHILRWPPGPSTLKQRAPPVISFLFWNVGKNARTIRSIVRLASSRAIDVVLLAECPDDVSALTNDLNQSGGSEYREVSIVPAKIRLFTRLSPSLLAPRFTSSGADVTIWSLRANDPQRILMALVHLPAKSGGVQDTDQHSWAESIARDIAQIEDDEQCSDTLLVGDMNMNPFDPGMVSVMGIHGLMTRDLAQLPDRVHKGRSFRRFYNPMWGLFGDRTPGPAASYFWNSSVPSNQHWHMFDQVLLHHP